MVGGSGSKVLARSVLDPSHFQVHADIQIKQRIQRPEKPHAQHRIDDFPPVITSRTIAAFLLGAPIGSDAQSLFQRVHQRRLQEPRQRIAANNMQARPTSRYGSGRTSTDSHREGHARPSPVTSLLAPFPQRIEIQIMRILFRLTSTTCQVPLRYWIYIFVLQHRARKEHLKPSPYQQPPSRLER
jgi:hypothetical protein